MSPHLRVVSLVERETMDSPKIEPITVKIQAQRNLPVHGHHRTECDTALPVRASAGISAHVGGRLSKCSVTKVV